MFPVMATIAQLTCDQGTCHKRLAIWRFILRSNADKCILFPFNADFQAPSVSYRILPEPRETCQTND